jgi:hypothetical protein
MTTEQKAKAYDEALKRASNLHKDAVEMENNMTTKTCEIIFPELKESEYERIRKEIIAFLKENLETGRADETWSLSGLKRWIAWLEKQDEYKSLDDVAKEVVKDKDAAISFLKSTGIMNENGELADEYKIEQGEQKPFDHENATIVQHDFAPKSAMEAINEENVDNAIKVEPKDYSSIDPHFFKSADKVEPKFKAGDWIIDVQGVSVNQIIGYEDDSYHIKTSCSKFYLPMRLTEKNYHLWTIQDAKDGDVLVNGSNIFIFHFINDTRLMGYCHVNTDDGRFYDDIGKNECFCLIDAVINPATKEQRDLLFQKMKESDYEWDAEKKELKEIEHKHTCELDNSYTHVKFPFKAKVKSSGTIVTIHGGQIGPDGKEWIKYQSDAEDGYKIYDPNNLGLVCEIDQNPRLK